MSLTIMHRFRISMPIFAQIKNIGLKSCSLPRQRNHISHYKTYCQFGHYRIQWCWSALNAELLYIILGQLIVTLSKRTMPLSKFMNYMENFFQIIQCPLKNETRVVKCCTTLLECSVYHHANIIMQKRRRQ